MLCCVFIMTFLPWCPLWVFQCQIKTKLPAASAFLLDSCVYATGQAATRGKHKTRLLNASYQLPRTPSITACNWCNSQSWSWASPRDNNCTSLLIFLFYLLNSCLAVVIWLSRCSWTRASVSEPHYCDNNPRTGKICLSVCVCVTIFYWCLTWLTCIVYQLHSTE